MTARPGSTSSPLLRAASVSTGSSRSNAACGSSRRRVCTATASPFSSTQAPAASPSRSSRGSPPMKVASPRGGFGEITRRSVEVQRSLPYCPSTKSSRPLSPIALPTSSSPPRSSACRAGRPVTTATARTWAARSASTSPASGWMCACSGSSTIGERVPSKSRRRRGRRRPVRRRRTAAHRSRKRTPCASLFQPGPVVSKARGAGGLAASSGFETLASLAPQPPESSGHEVEQTPQR